MIQFETLWRNLVANNTLQETNKDLTNKVKQIQEEDPVQYTKTLLQTLHNHTLDEKIQRIMCSSACHMPHSKLIEAKNIYKVTGSLELAHAQLESDFKRDIKQYKKLTDEQVEDIIQRGWGAAGILEGQTIIATKIPSQFHEYFEETDTRKKKFYYCHCPRIKQELLEGADLDSIYCYCGGGFYKDIWEYITDKEVKITVLNSLFDGDETCKFKIEIRNK